ncbi:MAG: hypothetical protein K5851_01000 [Lachnospiraceae bacterium]|nr:hypothetical protein [Lachnospiraceae bacterium]
MSDFKRIVSLLKFSQRFKMMIITAGLFTLFGFGFEIFQNIIAPQAFYGDSIMTSNMSFPLGGLFIAIMPMYFAQMYLGLSLSGMVSSSGMAKKLFYDVPVALYTCFMMVSYTVVVLLRVWMIHVNPEYTSIAKLGVVELGIICIILNLYTALVFKYYIISVILFIAGYLFFYFAMIGLYKIQFLTDIMIKVGDMSFLQAVGVGYLLVVVSLVVYIIVTRLIYNKPVSKKIFKAYTKKN